MQKTMDSVHLIPVADCQSCGEKDVPLSTIGPFAKEGMDDIWMWFCPKCDTIPDDESHIKGYISVEELASMGYTKCSDLESYAIETVIRSEIES